MGTVSNQEIHPKKTRPRLFGNARMMAKLWSKDELRNNFGVRDHEGFEREKQHNGPPKRIAVAVAG
jgi:hypothetical protein